VETARITIAMRGMGLPISFPRRCAPVASARVQEEKGKSGIAGRRNDLATFNGKAALMPARMLS